MVVHRFYQESLKATERIIYKEQLLISNCFFYSRIFRSQILEVNINPMLADLFLAMVTDTGLEPVASAMSMQRSRQLS